RARGGGRIETHHDHRVAMAFAILGARLEQPITFDDVSSVPTSYPAFFDTLAALGADLTGLYDPAGPGRASAPERAADPGSATDPARDTGPGRAGAPERSEGL